MTRSIGLRFYRLLQREGIGRFLLPRFIPQRGRFCSSPVQAITVHGGALLPPIWFHAASVGELESLIPLMRLYVEQPQKHPLIITGFSSSAEGPLKKLKQELVQSGAQLIYVGYSPWEGEWSQAIRDWKPILFITAKYEAWPDLWVSLKEAGVALVIISVRARRSLRVARWFCTLWCGGLPQLYLFPVQAQENEELRHWFPMAKISEVGEPRWDQVMARVQLQQRQQVASRSSDWVEAIRKLVHPCWVLGSLWLSDLLFLAPVLSQFRGTLCVVPHRVDSNSLEEMENELKKCGYQTQRSSQVKQGMFPERLGFASDGANLPAALLIDEIGFLLELYAVADFVYVGGGFEKGIHSTIEPAIYGVPIGVGPNKTEKFPEVRELEQTGQLRVLKTIEDLKAWWNDWPQLGNKIDRERWKKEAQLRLGASQKIEAVLHSRSLANDKN